MAFKQAHLACFFTVLWALASTGTAAESPGDDVAQDMINRLDTLVMPLIKEGHLNDTSLVEDLLTKLATKAQLASDKKAATDAPDTALDDCLLMENGTLHAWKICNATRATQKAAMTDNCQRMDDNGVATYTIEQSEYTVDGPPIPRATCNFETFMLEGGDNAGCESFVDAITSDAFSTYDTQYSTFSAAKTDCETSTDDFENTVLDCSAKGRAHREREAECVLKDTDLKVKVCAFQTALQSKCTKLSEVTTATDDLATQEENRNKELRTVSLTKCLFDRYSTHGETCFKTTVLDGCEKMVNGASEEYATTAAERIHEFRTTATSHTQVLPCAEQTITIGTNGLAYVKLDVNDEFSYYGQQSARTYSASATGTLSPAVCAIVR